MLNSPQYLQYPGLFARGLPGLTLKLDKGVVHGPSGLLLSHEKEQPGSFAEVRLDPDTVRQGEVSQKEAERRHTGTHTWGP